MNTLRVMLAGPYDTKGRYKGGIAYIVNAIIGYSDMERFGVSFIPFDTCNVVRSNAETGKISYLNIKNAMMSVRKLRLAMKADKPEILYFNTSRGKGLVKDILSIFLSNSKRICKVILHIHYAELEDILPRNAILRSLFLKFVDRYVDHLVLLSATLKEKMVLLGVKPDKISVIYNFHTIDMEEREIAQKIELSKSKEKKDILFLGSLDRRKGIIDLLKAVSKMENNVRLHIGGEAKETEAEKEIDAMIRQVGKDTVERLGYVDGGNKLDQLRKADILVLPSYGEGFPIVIPEAMASGCAIVTTNVGAIPEFFTSENGIMVTPGNIDELYEGMSQLCDSEVLYEVMLHNWYASVDYSLEAFLSRLTEVCRRVRNGT